MIILVIAIQRGIFKLSVHQSSITLLSSHNIHNTMVCSFLDSSVGHHLISVTVEPSQSSTEVFN